tara:strand:+ start:97 stop:234 length:138 start_codon:yes stop_codon:yes gene_type:complete
MIEALLMACCLGIPAAIGVLAVFRKGKRVQEVTGDPREVEARHLE